MGRERERRSERRDCVVVGGVCEEGVGGVVVEWGARRRGIGGSIGVFLWV